MAKGIVGRGGVVLGKERNVGEDYWGVLGGRGSWQVG